MILNNAQGREDLYKGRARAAFCFLCVYYSSGFSAVTECCGLKKKEFFIHCAFIQSDYYTFGFLLIIYIRKDYCCLLSN